jgi:hypothetical protein
MKAKLFLSVCVLIVSALFASACSGPVPAPDQPAPAEPRPLSLSVELREGQTHDVALDPDPDGTCEWDVEFSDAYLELASRETDEVTGGEVFTFRARSAGVTEVYFSCARRHEVIANLTIGADPALAEAMDEMKAREIAKASECAQAGALKEHAIYNDWTATWWIDLDADKEGCSPACVVDVRTQKAEVNWRCTGALPPEQDQ